MPPLPPRSGRRRWDWLFRNPASGRLAIVQWPNPALITFLAARGLEWVLGPDRSASRILGWIGTAALLWWAVDEVARGLSPFRRVLGAVVLIALGARLLTVVS